MTEIPDAAVVAAVAEYYGYPAGYTPGLNPECHEDMRRAIAAADKARGLDQHLTLPTAPSSVAVVMAIRALQRESWPTAYLTHDDVMNYMITRIKQALTAAYAIDGAQTPPQASPIAHGVEDGGAVGTAPSSANIEDLRDHVEGLRDQVDGLRAQVSALSTALVIARVRDQHGLPP